MATILNKNEVTRWVTDFITEILYNNEIKWENLSNLKCNYNKELLFQNCSVKKYVAKLEKNNISEIYFTADDKDNYNIEVVFTDETDKIYQLPFLENHQAELKNIHLDIVESLENQLLSKLSGRFR